MAADRPPLGAWIKTRRQQLGMKTQAALAARIREQTGLCVSRTSIANWEADIHYPERYIGALVAVLGNPDDEDDPTEQAIMALDAPERLRLDWVEQFRRARREPARRPALPPAQ